MDDWATKNAVITTNPIQWPLGLGDIPLTTDSPAYDPASNAGEVTDAATLKLTSNFTFTPVGTITDGRWFANNVTKLVLGSITNITNYNGRSGQIYVTYPSVVNLGSIYPTSTWNPVSLNWRGIDDSDGSPVEYLTGTVFLITYYINEGKAVYVTNVVS